MLINRGKKQVVFLFGDYEFLCKVFGIAGASAEFPLVLKSGGPGISSSMKLGVLFAFQGSPDYYWSFLIFFSEFLFLFSKRLSYIDYVVCSHNYIFSRLTKLTLLYKTHLVKFLLLHSCHSSFFMFWIFSSGMV